MQTFPYSDDPNKRYHTWNYVLRQQFNEKIFKAPIDNDFDYPNRDGAVAKGGCTFCSVSGSDDTIVAPNDPPPLQFQREIQLIHQKWSTVGQYIVYFQNFTDTHAPVDVVRHRFEQVVNEKSVTSLSIDTRPDRLPNEVVNYLAELNERFYLWIELDLQTTFEETNAAISRAHDYQTYLDDMARLRKYRIRARTHLINGPPGEAPAMMRGNVRRTIQDSDIQGIKLHLLHLMTNTKMVQDCNEERLRLISEEVYVSVICNQLEVIPPEIVIHRLTSDAPFEIIIGPMWGLEKWEVPNVIDAEMRYRNSY